MPLDYEKERIEKRRKRKKRKMRISSLLFAFVFIFWGVYYLLQSDLMNLNEIIISGNEVVQEEEIINISNLRKKKNIFKYSLREIEENVEKLPYVKEAEASRKFPTGITIHVKERIEYAIIPYMGSYIYIDEENFVLKSMDSYMLEDYVLITGVEFTNFTVGEKIAVSNTKALDRALNILKAARLTSIFDIISEINVSDEENLRLITRDGGDVWLGSGEDPAYLMVALDEILVNLYTKNIKNVEIDMRFGGNISVINRDTVEE